MKPKLIALIPALLIQSIAFAADPAGVETQAAPSNLFVLKGLTLQDWLAATLLIFMSGLTLLIIYQLYVIRMQIKRLDKIKTTHDPAAILDEPTALEKFGQKFSGLKPMSMEGELIMEGHEYDGIVELKNGMPPWLQAFFAVTILFAVSYWTYYYVLDLGPDQYEEYTREMDKAKKEKEERNLLMSGMIDETNVEVTTDITDLGNGKKLFIEHCATCHKDHGGGDSGPNLTDEYWIHGGGIKNIFKTVKIGYVEKGMPGWGDKLNPLQIKQVSSFIISIQGTNPAGAKPPQGELWKDEKTGVDSTNNKQDTLVVDSMKLK